MKYVSVDDPTNIGTLGKLVFGVLLTTLISLGHWNPIHAQVIHSSSANISIDSTQKDPISPTDSLRIDSLSAIDTTLIDTLSQILVDSLKPKINRISFKIKDSLAVYYQYDMNASSRWNVFLDTALYQNSYEDDLTRHNDNLHFHTGNTGSSAKSMQFKLFENINHDIGLHPYVFFNKPVDSFKYFMVLKPYSKAYFNTGSIKENFSTGIQFANQYDNGLHFTIDFRRINFTGLYNNQNTKHSDFNTGLYWNNNRHQMYLHYYNRTNKETHNGGIKEDIDFEATGNEIRTNIGTQLIAADTRHYLNGIKLTNKYLLFGNGTTGLDLIHQFRYDHQIFKFADDDTVKDTTYYGHLMTDGRGIRYYLDQKKLSNKFGFELIRDEQLNIGAHLRYQNRRINHEYFSGNKNILDLLGNFELQLNNWNTNGQLEFNFTGLENALNLKINSSLLIGKNWGKVDFTYQSINKPASFIQQELVLNNTSIWSNNFDIQNQNSFRIGYSNPKLGSKISYRSIFLNNHIFLNTDQIFEQSQTTIQIHQLNFSQGFNLWRFYTTHYLLLQSMNTDVLGLPELYTKHDLFVKLIDAKTKDWRVGGNIRYYMSDYLWKDQAALGTFYPTTQKFEDYWSTEIYTSVKISSFRLYLKYQNFEQLFDDKIDFQIKDHPQFDASILFGIKWIMFD